MINSLRKIKLHFFVTFLVVFLTSHVSFAQIKWSFDASPQGASTSFTEARSGEYIAGQKIVVIGQNNFNLSQVYALDATTGTVLAGFPVVIPGLGVGMYPPVVGHVITPTTNHIVINTSTNGIFVISLSGSIVTHILPSFFGYTTPALVDLNADGIDEIVLEGLDTSTFPNQRSLQVLTYNSSTSSFVPFSNWPLSVNASVEQFEQECPILTTSSRAKKIINTFKSALTNGDYIRAYNSNGTLFWSYQITTSMAWYDPTMDLLAVGKIQGIPGNVVVFSVRDFITPSSNVHIIVLDEKGSPLADWRIPNVSYLSLNSLRIGDLNGDGSDEVIVLHGGSTVTPPVFNQKLSVYKILTGALWPGFPVTLPNPFNFARGLGIADLNNDSKADIYFSANNTLYTGAPNTPMNEVFAYDFNGNLLNNFPLKLPINISVSSPFLQHFIASSAALFNDIDGDGIGDIAVHAGYGRFYMISVGFPYNRGFKHSWPEVGANSHSTKSTL